MRSAQHTLVKEVFRATRRASPAERDALLAAAAPEVAAEVRDLLALYGRPRHGQDGFLDPTGATDQEGETPLPDRIGGFRILRKIGEGGMGCVYEAEQEDPHRRVALKVLRVGFALPKMLARFEIEKDTLARLQHPGIAQIHEAGTAEVYGTRQPWFAMELVDGTTLTEHVRAASLPNRSRLELFAKICDAVHHAHQKGVIHRDLKPGNILVTSDGLPKVLDFGIARAADSDVQLTTLGTSAGSILGTLPYMSPEQARGDTEELDVRADVYALGVVLHELLTDRLPYDVASLPLPEAVRVICEREPSRVSTIHKSLRGDLETITLKALEKDKERRYGSAQALAEDVGRHLRSEPITARPASQLYKLRKFSRRNKAAVTVGAFAFVALIAASVISIRYGLRATRDLQRAQQADSARRRQLASSLETVKAGAVPVILDALARDAAEVLPQLRAAFADPKLSAPRRLRIAFALTALGETQPNVVLDAIPTAFADECANIVAACQRFEAATIDEIERRADAGSLESQARHAIVLLVLGRTEAAQRLCTLGTNIEPRVELIHVFKSWHAELGRVYEHLAQSRDPAFVSALTAMLGGVASNAVSDELREQLARTWSNLFTTSPDSLVHSTTRWALQRWSLPVPTIRSTESLPPDRNWFVTSSGVTLIRAPAGVGLHGEGQNIAVQFTHDLWVADRETSSGRYREYLADPEYTGRRETSRPLGSDDGLPAPDNASARASWADAVLFCNWLSTREGLEPCYRTDGHATTWSLDRSASGYRLATAAEFEYVIRGGTTTRWFFGDSDTRLDDYGRDSFGSGSTGSSLPRSSLPNPLGIFDLHGGAWESCTDLTVNAVADGAIDPVGRVASRLHDIRGGRWYAQSSIHAKSVDLFTRSAYSFRVVRRGAKRGHARLAAIQAIEAPPVRPDGSIAGSVVVRLSNPGDHGIEFSTRWLCRAGVAVRDPVRSGAIEAGGSTVLQFSMRRAASRLEPVLTRALLLVVDTRELGGEQRAGMELVRLRQDLLAPTPTQNKVLVLDGKSAVRVDCVAALASLQRFTLECWVRGDAPREIVSLVSNTEASGFGISTYEGGFAGPVGAVWVGDRYVYAGGGDWRVAEWTHLALCYDGSRLAMFVDGTCTHRAAATGEIVHSRFPLIVGADPGPQRLAYFFTGAIDEVRVSRVVRYRETFQPARAHTNDADTVLLLHFDTEVAGWHPDASDNRHHGQTRGDAKLVPEQR